MTDFARFMVLTTMAAMAMTADAMAQAPTSNQGPCISTPVPGAKPDGYGYIYDASTGRADGKTRFKRNEVVQVLVTNLNPFRYSYALASKDQAVPEPSIADLLTPIGLPAGPPVDKKEVDDAKAKVQGMAATAKTAVLSVADVNALREVADLVIGSLEAETRAFGRKVEGEQLVLSRPDAGCEELISAAARIRDLSPVPQASFDMARLALALYRAAVTQAPTLSDTEAAAAFAARVKAVEEAHDKLLKLVGEVRAIERAGRFHRVLTVGGFRTPTDVSLTLKRKDAADPKAEAETIHERNLNFGGGARFSASAGWSITRTARQTFGLVQGYARPSAGADPDTSEVSSVVGLTDDVEQRNGPTALVHVRLFDKDWLSLHVSLGATPKGDDDALRAEYIVGPSIGLAEDRFFATVGWYFGRTESLQDGWFIGQKVPESVTAVPVRSDAANGFAFALSYKIK